MPTKKKLKISAREFGRGKPEVTRFETLETAAQYIKDRWQGAEYCDGADAFHTDYCAYQLHGFTLSDVGTFGFDGLDRMFIFKSDAKPVCVNARACQVDDCDGGHCRKCGGHFLDFYHGQSGESTCDSCARDEWEAKADAAEHACLSSDGFDARASFPHASDPHWSDPSADFARW